MKKTPIKLRAEEPKPEEPKDEPKDKADDADGDGDGDKDAKAKAAHSAACNRASEAAKAMADAYAKASETDSASALMAAEDAGDEAMDCHGAGKASCMKMRGAAAEDDAPPDSDKPAPPAPGAAQALSALAGPGETQLQIAQLAGFGREVMKLVGARDAASARAKLDGIVPFASFALAQLGEKDPVRAKGVLGAKLELAAKAADLQKQIAASGAESDAAKRDRLWEQAVRDRKFQLAQVFAREDGANGPRRVLSAYAKAQNAAYPELAAFEAWIGSRVPEPGARAEEPTTALADMAEARQAASPTAGLSERDVKLAVRAGVDPQLLATLVARHARGAANLDPAEREGV